MAGLQLQHDVYVCYSLNDIGITYCILIEVLCIKTKLDSVWIYCYLFLFVYCNVGMIGFDMKETSNRNGKRIKNKKAIFTKIKDKLFYLKWKLSEFIYQITIIFNVHIWFNLIRMLIIPFDTFILSYSIHTRPASHSFHKRKWKEMYMQKDENVSIVWTFNLCFP